MANDGTSDYLAAIPPSVRLIAGILLTGFFAIISFGAFMEQRLAATPLALVFGALAIYSLVHTIKQARQRSKTNVAD